MRAHHRGADSLRREFRNGADTLALDETDDDLGSGQSLHASSPLWTSPENAAHHGGTKKNPPPAPSLRRGMVFSSGTWLRSFPLRREGDGMVITITMPIMAWRITPMDDLYTRSALHPVTESPFSRSFKSPNPLYTTAVLDPGQATSTGPPSTSSAASISPDCGSHSQSFAF